MKKYFFLLLVLCSGTTWMRFTTCPAAANITSREIINTMMQRIQSYKTETFKLKTWERIKGKDHYSDADCKLQNNPHEIYLHSNAEPNKNVEILWNPSLYGDKAKVNPGKFLPTLSMDIYGSRMRKDQHHTVLATGFSLFYQIIKAAVQKADKEMPGKFEEYFKYGGEVVWDGHNCYKITITDPTYKYIDYTVKPGETVESLEQSRAICGYQIIEKNPNVVEDFWSLKPGMTIKIPSSYAKVTELLIDKDTYLPLVQTMSDEVGQFERYEYHNMKVNAPISDQEFTTKYSGYGF